MRFCKIKNIGSVKLKEGKNYLNSSLFRALVFSNTKNLTNEHYDLLKAYLHQIDEDIITIINFEDKKEFKFLNKEVSLIFESFLYGDYEYIPYSDGESLIDIGGNVEILQFILQIKVIMLLHLNHCLISMKLLREISI